MGQSNSAQQISPNAGESVASAAAAEINSAGSAVAEHGHAHSDGIPHHTGSSGAGRFRNPWKSFRDHGFLDAITCFVKDFKKVEPVPAGSLPIVESDWKSIEQPPGDAVQVTWVGHASFLVQFDGINVLTDPIFSERCAPVQFAGPKRHVPPAFPTTRLPRIDAVIISHNHYDHLDTGTVSSIKDKVRMWFVPLGIKDFLVGEGINPSQVAELDWWQEQELAPLKDSEPKEDNNVRFVCTPCQHFSGRSLTDRNATLWASWSLIGPTKRFYFGGDTGYRSVPKDYTEEMVQKGELPVCPAFKEIGDKFGPFNLAALPIGAYSPRWFMSPIHCSPEDSVAVHIDVKAKQSVGMHWGTFILTDEPILEPPVRLAAELKRKGISSEAFVALAHGETRAYRN